MRDPNPKKALYEIHLSNLKIFGSKSSVFALCHLRHVFMVFNVDLFKGVYHLQVHVFGDFSTFVGFCVKLSLQTCLKIFEFFFLRFFEGYTIFKCTGFGDFSTFLELYAKFSSRIRRRMDFENFYSNISQFFIFSLVLKIFLSSVISLTICKIFYFFPASVNFFVEFSAVKES